MEVAKQFDEELTNGKLAASSGGAVGGSGQGANKKIADNSNKKKISRKEKTETEAGAEPSSSPIKRKESTKLPSIHVTNFNAQKNSSNHTTTTATGGGGANPEHSPGTASTSDLPTGPAFKAPPSVIVSKKRKERPRRQESSPEKTLEGPENRHRKRSSNNSTTPGLDYRKSFGGQTEKFTRYISDFEIRGFLENARF